MAHDGSVTLGDIISRFWTPEVREVARNAADAVLPECACCTRKAIPVRCFRCGSYVCQDHGYFSLSRRESLCFPCKTDLLKLSGEVEDDVSPWTVLGIEEGSDKKEIERAFRIAARGCHPDLHPADEAKESAFRQLQWARDAALGTKG